MSHLLPSYALVVAALLFAVGVIGVLLRRNVLLVLMSVELMLNAVNITLVAFSRLHAQQGFSFFIRGQALAFMTIAVAAAEAAVGLALVIGLFRRKQSTQVDELASLRG